MTFPTRDEMKELRATLNELAGDVKQLTGISIRQEEQLRYHIRRTDLLEESVDLLRKQVVPIRRHVELVNALCKIAVAALGVISTAIGIIAALGQLGVI